MRLRASVNRMCRTCTYDPTDVGTAAQQIACCTHSDCPLHSVRPVTTKRIPPRLLEAWNIPLTDLDHRARALVGDGVVVSGEPQISALLRSESTLEEQRA